MESQPLKVWSKVREKTNVNNLQRGCFFLLQVWILLTRIHGFFSSQVALVVKNLPANAGDIRDAGNRSLGQEDPLEEGMATHSRIPA